MFQRTRRLGVSFGELDCLGCFTGLGGLRLGGLGCSLDWLVLGCFSGLCCFNELGIMGRFFSVDWVFFLVFQ